MWRNRFEQSINFWKIAKKVSDLKAESPSTAAEGQSCPSRQASKAKNVPDNAVLSITLHEEYRVTESIV